MANRIRPGDPHGFNKGRSSRGHIGRNIGEITIKIKTIVQKPLMIKIINLRLRNLDN